MNDNFIEIYNIINYWLNYTRNIPEILNSLRIMINQELELEPDDLYRILMTEDIMKFLLSLEPYSENKFRADQILSIIRADLEVVDLKTSIRENDYLNVLRMRIRDLHNIEKHRTLAQNILEYYEFLTENVEDYPTIIELLRFIRPYITEKVARMKIKNMISRLENNLNEHQRSGINHTKIIFFPGVKETS